MNLNTVYLDAHKGVTFEPGEIAANLEHGIQNKTQLLKVIAARVAGFSRREAASLLNGVSGSPDALESVLRIFEETQPGRFQSLVDEVVSAVDEKAVRSVWSRIKQGYAVAPTDVLIGINARLQTLAAEKPFSENRTSQAEERFARLIKSKRTAGGNRLPFEGYSVTSY